VFRMKRTGLVLGLPVVHLLLCLAAQSLASLTGNPVLWLVIAVVDFPISRVVVDFFGGRLTPLALLGGVWWCLIGVLLSTLGSYREQK
jgi:hypothetical protein